MQSAVGRRHACRCSRWLTCLSAVALCTEVAALCGNRFAAPAPPLHATDLNGLVLQDVCFNATGPHHVFIIGDWGGVRDHTKLPVPADHRSKKMFPAHSRKYIVGVDNAAQIRVAKQMSLRALKSNPDYILNVGDNFYWGGIEAKCGAPTYQHISTGQWRHIFEDIYKGPGIDNKQWLGVLGNHDYGGWMFTAAWDQAIGYTWTAHSGRWMTPSQYWKVKVHYTDFAIDYYFLDSNVWDTVHGDTSLHNICGAAHNKPTSSCGPQGPTSLKDCSKWFALLWSKQMKWFEEHLEQTSTEWQIVVTHFPPHYGAETWKYFSKRYGLDLIITGHIHQQEVWAADDPANFLAPTTWVVSGGGGGITSQGTPTLSGDDDQYGFMDLTLGKEVILIEAISHGGQLRHTKHVCPRLPQTQLNETQKAHDCVWSTTTSTSTTTPTFTVTSTSTTTLTTTLTTTTRTTQTTLTSTSTITTTSLTSTSTTTPNYFPDHQIFVQPAHQSEAKDKRDGMAKPPLSSPWWKSLGKRIEQSARKEQRLKEAASEQALHEAYLHSRESSTAPPLSESALAAMRMANAASASSMDALVGAANNAQPQTTAHPWDQRQPGRANPFVYT